MLRHAFPGPAPGTGPYYDQYQDPPPGHYSVQPPHFRTQDPGGGSLVSRRGKKTFAEKLSNKLDKLAKPRDKERTFNKAYQEVYRDYYGNIVPVPRPGAPGSQEAWPHPHAYAASPAPKRTFHNVIRRGRSAPSHGPTHGLANRTWSGWEPGVYGDSVVYDEYHNFAINSNVCMCEDFLEGTHRGKKPKKKCKKCGNDRMMFDHHQGPQNAVMRRSISEESLSGPNPGYTDPFDLARRKQKMAAAARMGISQKPVFYDEQDEYEDIDFVPRPLPPPSSHTRSSSSRKIQPKSSRSRSPVADRPPARRSSSPVHKKSARTQSMIVNNRNLLSTKDNKEMQNIAIRASPMRSASSVTGKGKLRSSEERGRNVVTVNGCATKNSSIIYLSPAQDQANTPSSPSSPDTEYPGLNTTITISTSTPAKLYSQGSIRVSPYDLIKKYTVQDSPNSLSDSNLSSDDQQPIIAHNQKLSESEDFGFSDEEEPVNGGSTRHFLPGPNGFKISGQKIQIYSDGSVTATDAGTGNLGGSGYSLSDSESDQESDDSSYDADCSVLESPRIIVKTAEVPVKPPRRRSAEKDAARIAEDIERLQLQEERISSERQQPSVSSNDDIKTFPRSRISGPRPHHQRHDTIRTGQSSEGSLQELRSRSFNGSRESLNIFGSQTDFKNLGISKNFSSDVIREVYGSKTSLLKHLDQQREERRLRQLEDGGHQPLVPDHLSRSTDSVLSRPGDNQSVRSGLEETRTVGRRSLENLGSLSSWRGQSHHSRPQPHMFHDTTRLRQMTRPSLKDALHSFSGPAANGAKLGRIGVSQSFRERIAPPMRPTDPPPPPPPLLGLASDGDPGSSSYSLAKKFFSFNKTEIRRINRFLGIGESELRDRGESRVSVVPVPVSQNESHIYDIAENDELTTDNAVTVVDNSRFYTTSALGTQSGAQPGAQLKKNVSLRLRPKSNEFSATSSDPVKPPRGRRERSKSFTPSNPLVKTSLFNRSLSHIPKSASNSSLNGKAGAINSDVSKKITITGDTNGEANDTKRTFSSSDLVTIFPDEERRSFKDIRKILSSPSISSSCSSSTNQIYRPKSQLSNSSSVINNSIKEEQIVVLPVSAKAKEAFVEHIYEEIQDKDVVDNPQCKRPLPPLPSEKQPSPSRSSPIISDPSSPVKSIFEGASKYDILNYLEDARERGLTDCDLDLEEEEEAEETVDREGDQEPGPVILSVRNSSNRVSTVSASSSDSQESSESSGSGEQVVGVKTEKLSSVEIERNDSGLGSETGRTRSVSKVVVRKRSDLESAEDITCEDCDQTLETQENNPETSLCESCGTRRVERKEIITEIIETEIKYGRDLRIILEEFYRPMAVAGLLSQEQLTNVFLNVEDLIRVNAKFTEALKDAIEIALDQGDEDLCTVSIGKLFLEASPMLGAFKSYCTRQGSASTLLASLEREKELLRIFLKVSQMENTILRRMNLSSFLMVPVQRVTRYPLLLSRLVKVTPGGHSDKEALQEAQEKVEAGLDTMNQETTRDTGTTKLWRRISMINTPYRRSEQQIDLLGTTTWGVRKMVLETLGWGKEPREDVSFVLESRLNFTQPMDSVNWRNLFSIKMSPISAQLITLGQNTLAPSLHHVTRDRDTCPRFPRETGCREAALLLLKEKGGRYSVLRDPLMLDRCVVSWEAEWDDCFELTEFTSKESYIFKGEDPQQTLHWFHCIRFYCSSLGGWRRRRNGLANIMINGMARTEEMGREFNLIS